MPENSDPEVQAFAISDVGLVRRRNEDAAWLVGEFVRSGESSRTFAPEEGVVGVFAVADGVGGANAGDEASEFVITALGSALAGVSKLDDFTELSREVTHVADKVNSDLCAIGQQHSGRSGMSTTYTALVVQGRRAFWANAGDSRLYGFHDGSLRQITRDHTLREMTGDARIPGNIIVNCFGTERDFYVDLGELVLEDADAYLLCSDGLSDYVEHGLMERIVAEAVDSRSDLHESGRRLVSAAKEGGGGDNITLVLCQPVRG